MAELLGRAGALPVAEARDAEPVVAGHIYVIPPGCLMGIRAGALRLHPATARPAIPRPIDYFMCALAEEQGERCAGIVLSGADHDGTVGLKEIKAAGGLTLVQDPDTAKFPSMPASAIASGVPDLVLPVERMGQALLDDLAHAPTDLLSEPAGPSPPPRPPRAKRRRPARRLACRRSSRWSWSVPVSTFAGTARPCCCAGCAAASV
jgi:chemotaxis response regulator CheB